MTSAYLAISFLKQTPLPEEPLKEYLFNANIYTGKRNISPHDLTDLIITEKNKKIMYTRQNDDLTKEGAHELLKNNNLARQTLKKNISTISPQAKARPKPLNN